MSNEIKKTDKDLALIHIKEVIKQIERGSPDDALLQAKEALFWIEKIKETKWKSFYF